ncbi:MAG TPA: NUDIX hydrolase [Mycobacterium sp.]
MTTEDDMPHHVAAAALLITDRGGRVLMVATDYRDSLVLPGGIIEPDEPPAAAAEREVLEETGLYRRAGRLLVVQHIPPRPRLESVLQFVFDTAPVGAGEELVPQPGEVRELIWLAPEQAAQRSNPPGAVRLRAALAARRDGIARYLDVRSPAGRHDAHGA